MGLSVLILKGEQRGFLSWLDGGHVVRLLD
jgi:hypothetical protein